MISIKVTGIDEAIKVVGKYRFKLQDRMKEFLELLAEQGYYVAYDAFNSNSVIYAGDKDCNVVYPRWEGDKLVLRVEGEDVGFIEFGTGVHYSEQYPTEIPGDGGDPYSTLGMAARGGGYGKGHGADDVWYFYGDNPGTEGRIHEKKNGKTVISTQGNPPVRGMYQAAMTIADKNRILDLAKEVMSVK